MPPHSHPERHLHGHRERPRTADTRNTVTSLDRQQADYADERRRVQADLDRYRRMLDAGERLASIEFSVCPRCMQSLTQRQVPDGTCRVCLQPDPVTSATESADDPYETRQLKDQITEMDGQLEATAAQQPAAAGRGRRRPRTARQTPLSGHRRADRRAHHPATTGLQRRRAALRHSPRQAERTRARAPPVGPGRRHRSVRRAAPRGPGKTALGDDKRPSRSRRTPPRRS